MKKQGNEQLRRLITTESGELLLRATCIDHAGDFFLFAYSSSPIAFLSMRFAPAGGIGVPRQYLISDFEVNHLASIQKFVDEVLDDHCFETVRGEELPNVTSYFNGFSENSLWKQNEFFKQNEPKELFFPWESRQLSNFISRHVRIRVPPKYKALFDKPWVPRILRARYPDWNNLVADALLESGVTMTFLPDGIGILWLPPQTECIYELPPTELFASIVEKGFAKQKLQTLSLSLIANRKTPGLLAPNQLNVLSKNGRKLIADSLLQFASAYPFVREKLDSQREGFLESKVRSSVSKIKVSNVKGGRIVLVPSFGRSIMYVSRGYRAKGK
jgi:hypothetical protein